MKRFIDKYVLVCLLTLFLFSCNKTVDLSPSDLIDGNTAFQSVTDLEQGLLSAYASLDGNTTMYTNALLSDETKISNENRGQGQFDYKWQYTPASGGGGWGYYVPIGFINRELAVFESVPATTPAEETTKEMIRGELLALRAIYHFEILQRFAPAYTPTGAGIPYTINSDITATPARLTIAEVVTAIEKDLADGKAAPLPVAPQPVGTAGVIRLSKSVIAAYQARVALYKGDWDNAISFAAECITTCGKTLAAPADFVKIWTDQGEAELLFKNRKSGNSVGTMWQDTNGDVFYEPSDKLKGLFDRVNDVRFGAYFLINPSAGDTALINKFYTSPRGPKIVDAKLVRVAEMYLISAEAKAEKNDLTGAAGDYNALRTARITGYTNETFADKSVAISAILNERARELCFEGFRFFDLKRRKLPVERWASDVQSTSWQTLPAGDFHFQFPIPQASINSNPNMVQNPGY